MSQYEFLDEMVHKHSTKLRSVRRLYEKFLRETKAKEIVKKIMDKDKDIAFRDIH